MKNYPNSHTIISLDKIECISLRSLVLSVGENDLGYLMSESESEFNATVYEQFITEVY